MSKKLPYMRMFWDDFLADTDQLTNEELGAYTRWLGRAWAHGGRLQMDDLALMTWVCHCSYQRWRTLKPVLMQFVHDNGDGSSTQKRMSKEHSWSQARSAVARQSATHRWTPEPKKNNGNRHADAYANAYGKGHANAYANAMLLREDINNLEKKSTTSGDQEPRAEALGADPTGPPFPVSEALLSTKIFKKGR